MVSIRIALYYHLPQAIINALMVIFRLFSMQITSSLSLTLNQWQHLASTFDGQIFSIYINGTLSVNGTKSSTYTQLPSLNRTQNYVGKSNWKNWDEYPYSYIDDLRFYNKSLTQQEIVDLIMLNDATCSMTTTTPSTTMGGIITNRIFIFSFVDTILKFKKKEEDKTTKQQYLNVPLLVVTLM
jgi:hypothetical protein